MLILTDFLTNYINVCSKSLLFRQSVLEYFAAYFRHCTYTYVYIYIHTYTYVYYTLVYVIVMYIHIMLNKKPGYKKVRGQSEATMVIIDQKF